MKGKGRNKYLNNKKTFSFCEGLFVLLLSFFFYSCLCYIHIIEKRLTHTELLNYMHESTASRSNVRQHK